MHPHISIKKATCKGNNLVIETLPKNEGYVLVQLLLKPKTSKRKRASKSTSKENVEPNKKVAKHTRAQ